MMDIHAKIFENITLIVSIFSTSAFYLLFTLFIQLHLLSDYNNKMIYLRGNTLLVVALLVGKYPISSSKKDQFRHNYIYYVSFR